MLWIPNSLNSINAIELSIKIEIYFIYVAEMALYFNQWTGLELILENTRH